MQRQRGLKYCNEFSELQDWKFRTRLNWNFKLLHLWGTHIWTYRIWRYLIGLFLGFVGMRRRVIHEIKILGLFLKTVSELTVAMPTLLAHWMSGHPQGTCSAEGEFGRRGKGFWFHYYRSNSWSGDSSEITPWSGSEPPFCIGIATDLLRLYVFSMQTG